MFWALLLSIIAGGALIAVALFVWRLRTIAGRVGSFATQLRHHHRWVPGVAAYTRDHLVWYEVVSLSRRPRHQWRREDLMVTSRHAGHLDPYGNSLVEAHCRHLDEEFEIAAAGPALEGLISWLEAAPPRHYGVI